MHLIAGADETASETQLSEGWTYAVFPQASINTIDKAVTSCGVKTFHGKEFKVSQAHDYELFLKVIRQELEKSADARLFFTLQNLSWKNTFLPFCQRLISGSMKQVGVNDPSAIKVAEHLFPGLICLQRLLNGLSSCSIEIEVDSDSISKLLHSSAASFSGCSVPTAQLLSAAYEGYRKKVFRKSPALVSGGIRALDDANSRIIQAADVFGNFALSYVFYHLGKRTKNRTAKTTIFTNVFGDILDPSQISNSVQLVGANDIQLINAGGYTLSVEPIR